MEWRCLNIKVYYGTSQKTYFTAHFQTWRAFHRSRLTLVMLNKLRCHAHFQFSANQITWSTSLLQIHILNGKKCRSRSAGFFRSQLIWIYTVCKDRLYPGSAGLGLRGLFRGQFLLFLHYRYLVSTGSTKAGFIAKNNKNIQNYYTKRYLMGTNYDALSPGILSMGQFKRDMPSNYTDFLYSVGNPCDQMTRYREFVTIFSSA